MRFAGGLFGVLPETLKTIIRATVPRTLRNWLRSPSKSSEWLWDCARFASGVTMNVSLLPEWNLRCHPHAYKIAVRDQVNDPEQRAEFRNFVSHCANGMRLFDVGAHFGVFSLVAAHFGGNAVAIDPSPTATKMIAVQARLNGSTERIQIVRAAVTETSGTLGLLSSGIFSDGYFMVAKGRPKAELTAIRAITLDDLSAQYGVPTHIKIDVEGHEAAVLRGARRTLLRYSPLLFLELHNAMVTAERGDPNSPLDELEAMGYTTFSANGESVQREAILAKPIARVLVRRRPAPQRTTPTGS